MKCAEERRAIVPDSMEPLYLSCRVLRGVTGADGALRAMCSDGWSVFLYVITASVSLTHTLRVHTYLYNLGITVGPNSLHVQTARRCRDSPCIPETV